MTNLHLKPGWKISTLDEVATEISNRTDNPSKSGFERFVGLEHFDSCELKIRRWGSTSDLISAMKLFSKGDTLFARRNAYLRRASKVEFDGVCSGDAIVLREKSKYLVEGFLPLLMNTDAFWEYALANAAGSMSKRVNVKSLMKYQFPLPPKDEQRGIADILWAADESVESRLCVLDSIGSAWQSLIDNIVPDQSAVPGARIGRLDDLCEMQNGRPFPSSNYSDTGFKLLRPGNLAPNGRLIWPQGATVFLDSKFASENWDWIIQPGDVVINLTAQSLEDGFMGRVCLATAGDESLLNQRLGRFIVKSGTEREYLFRILQTSRFRRVVESHCEGSKVRHTYFRHFAALPVALLSQEEQQRVIKAGRDIDNAKESANQAVDKARSLIATLREHLLGGDT